MKWNYRVVKIIGKEDVSYRIYEVFYDDNGNPHSLTSEPISIYEGNMEDLILTLFRFGNSVKKPVLVFNESSEKFEQEEI